jgi:hypothetical protein
MNDLALSFVAFLIRLGDYSISSGLIENLCFLLFYQEIYGGAGIMSILGAVPGLSAVPGLARTAPHKLLNKK